MSTWICEGCKKEFEKSGSEEEKIAELHQNFGAQWKPEDCVKVCDDCYAQIMEELNALPPS